MRLSLIVIFLLFFYSSFSQDSIPIRSIDTLLPFFGKLPIRLHGYENRVVPYNSTSPLYVQISYKNSKAKHYEFFRIDSFHYMVLQFFQSDKGSSNQGLKSSGILKVIDKILDSSVSYGRSASGDGSSKRLYYYKGFSKEGEWTEYEDSLFHHKFWTGHYVNNRKIGVWNNYIYSPNGNPLIMQIDHSKDSTVRQSFDNIVNIPSLDSIKYFLEGRWNLGCEDDKDRRMLMSKCQLYDGHFGDDCNDRYGKENYYAFYSGGNFKRQKGETCGNFKNSGTIGKWIVNRINESLFLELRLPLNVFIKYRVWYLDRHGNMVADRL